MVRGLALLWLLCWVDPSSAQTPAKAWRLNLRLLDGVYSVCRLGPDDKIPGWATRGKGLMSVTRTADELSIVCAANLPVKGTKCEQEWRVFKMEGPFDFTLTGILVSVAKPLNEAGISILALSTYDTDYVMVKAKDAEKAVKTLTAAGHTVRGETQK